MRKNARWSCFVGLFVAAILLGSAPAAQATWVNVFNEEFGSAGLNTAVWTPGWQHGGISGPMNGTCVSAGNVSQPGNGYLYLNISAAKNECTSEGQHALSDTGALVESNPSDGVPGHSGFSYLYGLVEWRVWLPGVEPEGLACPRKGCIPDFPALWSLPVSHTSEIDTMEGLGRLGQACYHLPPPFGQSAPGSCLAGGYAGEWHTFGADWEPGGTVTFYYDGANVGQLSSQVITEPQYLVMDMVNPIDGQPLVVPDTMTVDYVRVWVHPQPPAATTEGAEGYGSEQEILKGTVNPNGQATSYHFDYGTTTSYGQSTGIVEAGSGITSQPAAQSTGAISAATTYHYRLVATNASGTTYGADREFTSPGPAVETGPASEVGEEHAILTATVNPRGSATHYHFEFGRTTEYGETDFGEGSAGSGTTPLPITQFREQLAPNTVYHYRIVAVNEQGNRSWGQDVSFTTLPNFKLQCSGVNITGQGSTLQRTAQGVWSAGFNASTDLSACSGSQGSQGMPHVSYSPTGSGAGLSSWGVGGGSASYGPGNAFVGTDEPPSSAQRAEIESHESTFIPQIVESVPVLQAAVAVVVHLPQGCAATSQSATGRLALNYTTLERIFRGTITKWSEITDNGDKLSGSGCTATTAITRVVRRDQSGTSHIFKKYLGVVNGATFEGEDGQPTTWAAVAEGAANTHWPKAAKVVRPSSNGAEALLATVSSTAGSISYVNLSDARANTAFVPPAGGNGTPMFWVAIQNKGGETPTYADPSSNKDVATPAEANCSKEEYSNGENPFPPESVYAVWSSVTTKTEEPKYPLCGLTYALAFSRYSAFAGTEGLESTTARNFLTFVLDTSKEKEGNGDNGGQTLLKKHDYLDLSGTVLKEAQKGASAPGF